MRIGTPTYRRLEMSIDLRVPKAISEKLTALALVGLGGVSIWNAVALEGSPVFFAIVISFVLLSLAAVLAGPPWWAYALIAVGAGILFIGTLCGSLERLSDTDDPTFLKVVVLLGFSFLALAAGARAAYGLFTSEGTERLSGWSERPSAPDHDAAPDQEMDLFEAECDSGQLRGVILWRLTTHDSHTGLCLAMG